MPNETNTPNPSPGDPSPRETFSYVSSAKTKAQRFKTSSIENRDGIGMAAAVIMTWLITDIGQFVIPAEVMSAFQYLLGAVVARIRGD